VLSYLHSGHRNDGSRSLKIAHCCQDFPRPKGNLRAALHAWSLTTRRNKVASRANLPANRDADACGLYVWTLDTALAHWFYLFSTYRDGLSGNRRSSHGNALDSTAQPAPGRSNMRKSKDLNACIAILEAVQSGNDVTPEQKQAIEEVIGEVRKIRRKQNPKRNEIHESVRNIAEKLIRAFMR
jgi:hypothetical protein